ncbi:MAG: hypothetical protein DSY47_06080 [Hydrogenothermus sp.]|nr:MAG: hypothetical protein DSY47_06080 [Hydrogenothermus sp.]
MKLKSLFKKDKNFSIKITKAGWIYITITILLGVAGANTGNNLIYLISSAFLAFMGISGIIAKVNLSKLDITIDPEKEIFAGYPAILNITISNQKKFFPSFLITVNILGKYITFPLVNKKSKETKTINLVFEKRGINRLKNIKICSVFPFNFFERCIKLNKELEVLVFPKPEKYNLDFGLSRKSKIKKDIQKTSLIKSYEGEITGFSKYYKGVPLKYISWKHYAKTGELVVKEFMEDSNTPIIVDLDKMKTKNIEKKLSFATYLVLTNFKNKKPVGLKAGKLFIKPSLDYKTRHKILRELALYDID